MLYKQIASNKRKTVLVFTVFFAILAFAGAAIGQYFFGNIWAGVIISLIITVVYAFLMYNRSTSVVMSMNHAHQIKSAKQAPELFHIVEDMAMVANVPRPDIYIIDDPSPNAFATGRDPEHSAVAVTSGLFEIMDREELEGVLSHEISHIRNYDIRVSTISIALSSAIIFISSMLGSFFRWGWIVGDNRDRDRDNGVVQIIVMVIGLIFAILGPLIATIVNLAISRNREYLADASGVELTRNPQGLIDALKKLENSTKPMKSVDDSSAALYIDDPKKKKHSSLFDDHPPLEDRIARLEKM